MELGHVNFLGKGRRCDPSLKILNVVGMVKGSYLLRGSFLALDNLHVRLKLKRADKCMGIFDSNRFHIVLFTEFLITDFFAIEVGYFSV